MNFERFSVCISTSTAARLDAIVVANPGIKRATVARMILEQTLATPESLSVLFRVPRLPAQPGMSGGVA